MPSNWIFSSTVKLGDIRFENSIASSTHIISLQKQNLILTISFRFRCGYFFSVDVEASKNLYRLPAIFRIIEKNWLSPVFLYFSFHLSIGEPKKFFAYIFAVRFVFSHAMVVYIVNIRPLWSRLFRLSIHLYRRE